MKFTARSLNALKPQDKRYEVSEDNGHGLRIRVLPSGSKVFIYRYKYNGKSRGMTLGEYPTDASLADAHQLHSDARTLLRKGIDPGAKKKAEVMAEKTADSVAELVDFYIERHAKRHKKTWQEDQRMLEKDVLPLWSERKAKDIKRRDVMAMLDGIVDRGSAIVANRTLEVVRKMFNFAIERDIVENNPCYMVKAPSKENQRDRVLNAKEVRVFWRRLYRTNMSELCRLALKLQLVTAQRRGEIIKAKWKEVDLDNSWWIISDTKNQLSHRVPLSPLAIALLHHIQRLSGTSEWLFPNPSGTNHMQDGAVTKALARNREVINIAHFTPHDLRRTAASMMASAGTPRLVISKVLNHVETGITAVYDRHSYDKEKQEALDAWSSKLWRVVSGKPAEVIELATSGKQAK